MEENKVNSKDNELNEVLDKFHKHGLQCGDEISKLAMIMHPDAICVIRLYRSCIVVVQSEEEKNTGDCTIHTYADPHWMGEEISIDTLSSNEFHSELKIYGHRSGPNIEYKKGVRKIGGDKDEGKDDIEI